MRAYLILLCYFYSISINAQESFKIKFVANSGFSEFGQVNTSIIKLNSKDSIQLETLKIYISELSILNDKNVIWKEQNSFHLIDFSHPSTLLLILKLPSYQSFNKLKFNLGIDSLTNVSGAMGGDLDPTNGMYWTWQSGYINFKLEGKVI